MKFFVDTADTAAIKELYETGLLDGVTTNPSLIAKSGRDFKEVIAEICSIVPGPVSAEVASLEYVAAPVVLDSVSARGKKCAGRGFDLAQGARDGLRIDLLRDVIIFGPPKHVGQPGPYLLHGPSDRVAVHRGIHTAESVQALRAIHIAALQIETVEPQ